MTSPVLLCTLTIINADVLCCCVGLREAARRGVILLMDTQRYRAVLSLVLHVFFLKHLGIFTSVQRSSMDDIWPVVVVRRLNHLKEAFTGQRNMGT